MRLSLKTRDRYRAQRKLNEIEDRASGRPRKNILDAVEAFHAQHDNNSVETKRKYKRILSFVTDFLYQAVNPLHRSSRYRSNGSLCAVAG